jgi:outer membrane protein TolC
MHRSLLLASLTLAFSGSARAESRTLTLDECVSIAVARNPDVLSSAFEVEAAGASLAGVRGEFGPKVRAEGNALQWNSAFNLPFALPGATGPTPVLTVRDAFTWTASVSVIQPLNGIFGIYDLYKVQDLGVDVAGVRREAAKRDVAFRAAEAYFRLLEANRLAEVATASVSQLEAQEKQAESLLSNGVIGKNDLLRAELALAGAKQRVIQTKGQVALARGRLAVAMGIPPDSEIDAAAFVGEPPAAEEPTIESAEAHAAAQRLEVLEVQKKIDQEGARLAFAKKRLFPVVNLVGNYTHAEGAAFQQKNAAYVGAAATWDVWDWGTTISGIHEADARRHQAELAQRKLEDEVRLEARQLFVNAGTAREALGVARVAKEQAEENYRIVTKRFENNASTSFDVVDAEALLTQARAQVESALYGYLVARAALQRATGAPLPRVR